MGSNVRESVFARLIVYYIPLLLCFRLTENSIAFQIAYYKMTIQLICVKQGLTIFNGHYQSPTQIPIPAKSTPSPTRHAMYAAACIPIFPSNGGVCKIPRNAWIEVMRTNVGNRLISCLLFQGGGDRYANPMTSVRPRESKIESRRCKTDTNIGISLKPYINCYS